MIRLISSPLISNNLGIITDPPGSQARLTLSLLPPSSSAPSSFQENPGPPGSQEFIHSLCPLPPGKGLGLGSSASHPTTVLSRLGPQGKPGSASGCSDTRPPCPEALGKAAWFNGFSPATPGFPLPAALGEEQSGEKALDKRVSEPPRGRSPVTGDSWAASA